jgi:hypothetical protein
MADQQARGEADSYYQGTPAPVYQSQPPAGGPYASSQQYQQPFEPPSQKKYEPDGSWQFDQAFKVEKPKWNDLWAGILFLIVSAGFVVVAGISLQGYAATRGQNGSGIYDGTNDFGLSTNT